MSELQATPVRPAPGRATSGAEPVVVVDDVVHSYKGRRALDHVSFEVPAGSLHGFVGPNGAGKTTSLKIICTLLRPQYGVVKVFGQDVVEHQHSVRRRIGFMPDHFSSYRQMTVFEYLDFFAAAYGQPFKQRTTTIEEVLALTDMEGRRDDLISGLSRGMQQRVGLARVLVNDPDLLLLDEPASGLDPRARIELMEILKALKSMGKTIFISSHILSELAELCDSVTIIDRGRVKFSGKVSQLLARTGEHPMFRLTVGDDRPEWVEQFRAMTGVVSVEQIDDRPEYRIAFDWTQTSTNDLLRGVIDLGVVVTGFAEDKRHLNEAFLDLTERGVRWMYHGLAALMTRALRLDARLLRGHLFRLAFVVLVYFSLLIAQLQALSFGAPGLRFFTNLVWLNACFICLAGVSFFATAITEEKEEDTLGLLRMAGLNPLGILLGKSTSRLLQAVLLLIIQFPFTLLAVTLGGVLTVQVVAMYVALVAFIILLANVALVFSVMCQKGGNAAGLTALWLLLYIAAWPMADGALAWFPTVGITKAGFWNTTLIQSVEIIRSSCVFERIGVILSTGFDEPVLSTQVVGNSLGGLAAFLLAWALFNAFAKNATPTAQTRGLLGRSKSRQRIQVLSPGRAWNRSLIWKDYNFIAGGSAMGVIKLLGYVAVFGLIVLFNSPPLSMSTNWRDIGAGTLMLWCLLTGLDLSLMSSRLFHDELKGQTMSALLMLPRSVAYVGYTKLIGCMLGMWPALAALIVALVAVPNAGEFFVNAIDEPGTWAFVMSVLVFCHVVVLLSLFVKWGALPLAILLMMVSVNCCPVLAIPFLLLSSSSNGEGAALAAIVTLWILTGVISFVLQVMIGARLQEIGSK